VESANKKTPIVKEKKKTAGFHTNWCPESNQLIKAIAGVTPGKEEGLEWAKSKEKRYINLLGFENPKKQKAQRSANQARKTNKGGGVKTRGGRTALVKIG